jgi:predicted GNAT family acetyltransferase
MTDEVTVRDDPQLERFEVWLGDERAGFAAYHRQDGVVTFTHTEVDDRFEGRGLGSTLVRGALDAARQSGAAVLPVCPFVRSWLRKHPDYVDLVPAERRARFGLADA